MRDVFFYSSEFELIQQFGRYISLNITKKYCGYGTIEIHFPLSEKRVIDMLRENDNLIVVTEKASALITGWRLGEDIAVFGKTPEWLMTKRTLLPFSLQEKTPEEIAIYAVENAMGDFVEVEEPMSGGATQSYSSEKAKTAYEVVCEALEPVGLGFSIFPDIKNKKFLFRICRGRENPVTLSKSNRTAYDCSLVVDMQEGCSAVRFQRKIEDMGSWSASANSPALASGQADNAFKVYKITTDGIRFGLSCKKGEYLYCDAADGIWKTGSERPLSAWDYLSKSEETGISKRECVLAGVMTPEEARDKLEGLRTERKTETMVRKFSYGKDYELGDILRVQTEFGDFKITERKRVDSVDMFFDVDSQGEKPTLKEE